MGGTAERRRAGGVLVIHQDAGGSRERLTLENDVGVVVGGDGRRDIVVLDRPRR